MLHRIRADIAARFFLTIGALLPYWRLLTFKVIYVTDDYFTSDIFNGELPGRVLIGRLVRDGQWPVWTSQLCSGVPLAGIPADPLSLATFTFLSPAAALDLYVIVLLLVAAHGAYGLARRFGADRSGAVLAGLAFAGSGYIACQLKHLGIVSTVVWLPVGLTLIDSVLGGDETRARARRALCMAAFGLVFAQQVLSAFPQSAYICALVYGSFAVFRFVASRQSLGRWPARLGLMGGLGIATALGAAAGAVVLLPLAELGSWSDRASGHGWEWATRPGYWVPNLLMFFVPYVNGDVSNNTDMGPSLFWEDYGYVGLATILLAFYGAYRDWRRPPVAFSIAMTVVAYFFVLGAATPVYHVAYQLLPGLSQFRFPTRFLIVVELGLAVLGAIGLARVRADLAQHWRAATGIRFVGVAVCLITALDLFIHQPRQNPMVSAGVWLAAPPTVEIVRAESPQPRTFTPRHRVLHRRAYLAASGWQDVGPYFRLRDLLAPNTGGGFWNTPSADCYAGVAPRWHVDVWGDHNRDLSLVTSLANYDFDAAVLRIFPTLPTVLRTFGVSHLLSADPQLDQRLTLVSRGSNAYVYRVDGAARVRFVRAARRVGSDKEALARLGAVGFDPDAEILLHEAPESIHPLIEGGADGPTSVSTRAPVVTHEDSRQLVIEAEAPADGFLLVADTFYPGWTAQVDGQPTPVFRANVAVRGIQLSRGRHEIRFSYEAAAFMRGLRITLLAVTTLVIWLVIAAWVGRRTRHS